MILFSTDSKEQIKFKKKFSISLTLVVDRKYKSTF